MNGQQAVLCTTGTRGDIVPFIRLAQHLLNRDYRVTILSNLNWESIVKEHGIDFFPIAPRDPSQSARNDLEFFKNVTLKSFRTSFDFVADLVHRGVHPLVLYRNNMLGAGCAAKRFNLVSGNVCLQPSAILSRLRPSWPLTSLSQGRLGALGRHLIIPALFKFAELTSPYKPFSDEFRRTVGLKAAPLSSRQHDSTFMILLCPDWFAMPQADWPHQCYVTGFPSSGRSDLKSADVEVTRFLAEHGPPLVFTPGTGISDAELFFANAIRTARALNMPAILLSPAADQKRMSAPGILVRNYIDLPTLLPHCRALVHHGGIGTTAQAIRAGKPQLVIPDRFDQPDNGFRVGLLGLGGAIMDRGAPHEVWTRTLERVLNSSHVRTQCETAAALSADEDGAEHAIEIAHAYKSGEILRSGLEKFKVRHLVNNGAGYHL